MTFLCYWQLFIVHHVSIFRNWHILSTLTLLWLYIDCYTLTFLYYLHLYLYHYVLIFPNWESFIIDTYTYLNMCCILHNDIFVLVRGILISACVDFSQWYFYICYTYSSFIIINFETLAFICYLVLYFYHPVLPFTHWDFYISYSYTYIIMYLFLHIDVFILLTLTLISLCIDF